MVSANLKDWKEVTKGIYRYLVSANVAYEIYINYWGTGTDILSANASLYMHYKDKTNAMRRECLAESMPVMACIGAAIEDDEEYNTTS